METSIQGIMDRVIRLFNPEKAAGIDASIQFIISGDQGGDWFAIIRDKQLTVSPGTVPNPRLTMKANTQDIISMFNGKLNPMTAYMQGKIQAQGDLGLAMKLAEVFKPPSA
jgi:putative sterol carrier protein